MTAAAVFDLDNTLVRGSCLFHFGRWLVRTRMVSPWDVLRFASVEASYVRRRAEPAGMIPTVVDRALALVEGRAQADLRAEAGRFATRMLARRLDRDVHLQVGDFREAGYVTLLATASPQELADAVARELGMDGAIGTRAEVRDGRYTGRLTEPICHGAAKARRVRLHLDERGLDVQACWAFSDSVNDLPLLALVGHPVATNPDPELAAIARVNDWRVLSSRQGDEVSWARLNALFPFPF